MKNSTIQKFLIVMTCGLFALCGYLIYELSLGNGNNLKSVLKSYSVGYQQGVADADAYYQPIVEEMQKQLFESLMDQYE